VPLPVSVSITGTSAAMFSATNNCGPSLAVGTATCAVAVSFKPTSGTTAGAKSATLNLGTVGTVALSGSAVAPSLSPTGTLSFGTAVPGGGTSTLPVTLRYTGNGAIAFSNLFFTGLNPSAFSAAAPVCSTTGTGATATTSCTINVTMTVPTLKPLVNLTATLNIADTAGTQTKAVSGR